MRKLILSASVAATALALAACSDDSEYADTDASEATSATATPVGAEATMADDTSVLDAGTATAAQLAGVDGIDEDLAAAIVAGRPYASVTDLNAALMENLSQEQTSAVLERVFVPINLNEASEEEIRLVPGMTDKMVYEFREYRPYADMDEFDREIGKYVDEAEVARFRQYVTL